MTKEQPLWYRLYFSPVYTELARLVGYGTVPLPELREKVGSLGDTYGQKNVQDAANAILHIDNTIAPGTARLTDAARTYCWQLLGPPPEKREWFERGAHAPPPLSPTEPKPVPKPRTRKKGGANGSPG